MNFTMNLEWTKVRQMCIDYDFYTMGTNEQYGKMFDMCGEIKSPEDLRKIAEDIYSHSKCLESVEEIMQLLANRITVHLR